MNVMTAMVGALRSATTPSAATSAPVRMDTDWTQMDTPAMVILYISLKCYVAHVRQDPAAWQTLTCPINSSCIL